jgi:hypothetical protein
MEDSLDGPPRPVAERLSANRTPELWFASEPDLDGTWTLRQDGVVVGVLSANPLPTSIEVAGETWSGQIESGRTGWWAEFSRGGIGTETLSYHPRLVRGGDFRLGENRYRLRSGWLRGRSILRDDSRDQLATIGSLDRSAVRKTKIDLGPAAEREPRLAALLLASCLALIWANLTPRVGGAEATVVP